MQYICTMDIILIEPHYIGNCSYWNVLLRAGQIVLDYKEHYVRRSYRNRACLLGANGILRLSIPLERGKNQHSAMHNVRISYNERWQDLHWQSFISAYRRSPFFEYYEEEFRKLYTSKFEFLVDFNFQMMQLIAKILKTELSVTFADKYYPKATFNGNDCRDFITPGIVNCANATSYLQVFSDRFSFVPDLCVLDVIFNLGNQSKAYLMNLEVKF